MYFIFVLSYFDWLLFEVGLQVVHDNAARATCNADLNILQNNETVVTQIQKRKAKKSNSQTSYYKYNLVTN